MLDERLEALSCFEKGELVSEGWSQVDKEV